MRKLVLTAALLLATMSSAFAHGPKWKNKRYRQYRAPIVYGDPYYAPGYYAAPYGYGAPYAMWRPAYTILPTYYRTRMRPVPAGYYGPAIAPGCRRAYLDGYFVDYRPSNFLVVNFSRAW